MQSQFSAIAAHVEYNNSKQLIIFAWHSQEAAFTVSSYDKEEDEATTMAAHNKTAMCSRKREKERARDAIMIKERSHNVHDWLFAPCVKIKKNPK